MIRTTRSKVLTYCKSIPVSVPAPSPPPPHPAPPLAPWPGLVTTDQGEQTARRTDTARLADSQQKKVAGDYQVAKHVEGYQECQNARYSALGGTSLSVAVAIVIILGRVVR